MWNANALCGVIGAFNVQGSEWSRRLRRFIKLPALQPAVSLSLRPSLVAEPPFQTGAHAVYAFRSHELRAPVGADEVLSYGRLEAGEWELFTVAPIATLALSRARGEREAVEWAPLGLLDMLNGGGAVVQARGSDAGFAKLRVRGCGAFGMYASRPAADVRVDGRSVASEYDGVRGLLRFELEEMPREGELHDVIVRFI